MNEKLDQSDLSKLRELLIADLLHSEPDDLAASLQKIKAIDIKLEEQQKGRLPRGWRVSLGLLAIASFFTLFSLLYHPLPGSVSLEASTKTANLQFERGVRLNLGEPGGILLNIQGNFEVLDSLDKLVDFGSGDPMDIIEGSVISSLSLTGGTRLVLEGVKENIVQYQFTSKDARIGLSVPKDKFCRRFPEKCSTEQPLNFLYVRSQSGILTATLSFGDERAPSTPLVSPVGGDFGFESFSFQEPRAIEGLVSSVSQLNEATIIYKDYGNSERFHSFGDEIVVRISDGFAVPRVRDGLIYMQYSGAVKSVSDSSGEILSPNFLDYLLARPRFIAILTFMLSVFGLLSASFARIERVLPIIFRRRD